MLLVVDLDSSLEGDGERVERGLPPRDPASSPATGRVEAADGEVQAFQSRLLVGEVTACAHRAAEACVQTLDRVGRVDDLADLRAVSEEGHKLWPGVLPELDDRRYRSSHTGRKSF